VILEYKTLQMMNNKELSFLITVDVEGDNLWSRPQKITTENAKYLLRFQCLCEKYGFKPTYLVNYEMAKSLEFQEFGSHVIRNNAGEIGCHIHSWNNPPLYRLTENDSMHLPYLFEYPKEIIRQKVDFMTKLLEDTFHVRIKSHRAGRWGFNEIYAQILFEYGYCVDCSVTPFVSWTQDRGDPHQKGGSDYSNFMNQAYFLNLNDISKTGESTLLEIPVTIVKNKNLVINFLKSPLKYYLTSKKRSKATIYSDVSWFRPTRRNLKDMLRIINTSIKEKNDYIEFMIHSSELMPGGSPNFKTNKDIEKLYISMNTVFYEASRFFKGKTLAEFYDSKLKPKD
jgi:hypothetical protein